MAEERVQRRLAAILAADVVGYSRLIGIDEEGTIARLKKLREGLLEPIIAENRGRLVKLMGDGALVEFASAVDAVRCGMEVQRRMAAHNAALPADQRIAFRIGVNLGDIVIDGDDILGDGVNLAARFEGLAEPGEVFASETVRDHVEGKLAAVFDDLGEQTVKNIARPLRVFRIRSASADEARESTTDGALPLPDKPSIAVLPFENMSREPEQEYFADGIADEMITALSRLHWLIVVARTSSFMFKGQAADVRDVARQLGVRYVLEGSVRKDSDRLRIIARLINAATGAHIWAERFEGRLSDVFELQDQITEKVVGAIEPKIRSTEIERARRKRPESLDAYDYYLRALPHYYALTTAGISEALRLLEKALAIDPGFAAANALAAWLYFYRVAVLGSASPEDDRGRGISLAHAAIDADPDDPMVLCQSGRVLIALGYDFEAGIAATNRAVELSPNSAHVLDIAGWSTTFVGDQEKALAYFNRALRVNPSDPLAYRFVAGRAMANLLLGRFDEAIAAGEDARRKNANFFPTSRILAAAYAQLGRKEEAAEALARILEQNPAISIAHLRKYYPYQIAEQAERMWHGLRKAGLPE